MLKGRRLYKKKARAKVWSFDHEVYKTTKDENDGEQNRKVQMNFTFTSFCRDETESGFVARVYHEQVVSDGVQASSKLPSDAAVGAETWSDKIYAMNPQGAQTCAGCMWVECVGNVDIISQDDI